jgi:transcription elongation factor GreA
MIVMSFNKRPISIDGLRKLNEEMDRLIRIERPSVIKEIEIALGHGDLSENAEFTYAKEKMSLIETRLRNLQDRISTSEVIDLTNRPTPDKAVFGACVTIEDLDTNEIKKYQLLGQDEADIANGIISVDSPVGKALIGKEVGDIVEVRTPNGIRECEIIDIK